LAILNLKNALSCEGIEEIIGFASCTGCFVLIPFQTIFRKWLSIALSITERVTLGTEIAGS
jgi:hypothetical protein